MIPMCLLYVTHHPQHVGGPGSHLADAWTDNHSMSEAVYCGLQTCLDNITTRNMAWIWWLSKWARSSWSAIWNDVAWSVNTLRLRQNGRLFPDDIFKYIFLNENLSIMTKISLKFVPEGWFNKIAALVQIIAWHQPGDKPLSEPMMV